MNALTEDKNNISVTNIKVPKEIADLARVYCIFNNRTLRDFTTSLLEKELEDFKKRIEAAKQLKNDS